MMNYYAIFCRNIAGLESADVMYSKFIKIAQKSGSCGLCKRRFGADEDESKFIDDVL